MLSFPSSRFGQVLKRNRLAVSAANQVLGASRQGWASHPAEQEIKAAGARAEVRGSDDRHTLLPGAENVHLIPVFEASQPCRLCHPRIDRIED